MLACLAILGMTPKEGRACITEHMRPRTPAERIAGDADALYVSSLRETADVVRQARRR